MNSSFLQVCFRISWRNEEGGGTRKEEERGRRKEEGGGRRRNEERGDAEANLHKAAVLVEAHA